MSPPRRHASRMPALALIAAMAVPSLPARASDPEPPALGAPADLAAPSPASGGIPEFTNVTAASVALTAAGFASAFLLHESCHVMANLVMGNVPTLQPVKFMGVIPFFAVSPDIHCTGGSCFTRDGSVFAPGPRGYYLIVSSGLVCQAVADEIILTAQPDIRHRDAPFLKGMLLFNTLTSVGYAFANFLSLEPPAGDVRAVDELGGVPRGVMGALVLTTAALDIVRYFAPDLPVVPWVSRGTKVVTVGLVFAF